MKFFAACVCFIGAASLNAQTPRVPDKIQFAGITLTIRDDAKKEIQKDVNLLTQHSGYFSIKTDRAKLFFPLIEKIFEEEGVPNDFKFLALQESSLVADAVSSSNAVGFWQFKDFTAMEVGLRVDDQVDERMNVVAASKGAAKYLTQNNTQFNNWVYTLQSYQMGVGGVKKVVSDLKIGMNEMEITSDTYWYVKRFLAHKIAFENSVAGESQMKLIPFQSQPLKRLKDIARELSVEESILKEYNKWLKADAIPEDREYTVIVPVGKLNKDFNTLWLPPTKSKPADVNKPTEVKADSAFQINGVPAIIAKRGENLVALAQRGNIPLDDFVKFNEIEFSFPVIESTIFLLEKKKNRASAEYHKVKKGENLWLVSQRYAIKINRLRKYNSQLKNDSLTVGEIVWLSSKRPTILESPSTEIVVLDKTEPFNWPTQPISEKQVDAVAAPIGSNVIQPDTLSVLQIEASVVIDPDAHTVLPKETLYSIASQHDLKITDLLKWNSLIITDKLKPGQILILADPSASKDLRVVNTTQSVTFHEVKQSETLYSIARQYGVTIRDLMEWNNKKDFTLSNGEKLQIKGK